MAIAFVQSGTGQLKTSSTSLPGPPVTASVGNQVLAYFGFDNTGTTTPTTIAPTMINGWTAAKVASFDSATGTSGGGARGELWLYDGTAATAGINLGVRAPTLSAAVTASTVVCFEFSGVGSGSFSTGNSGTGSQTDVVGELNLLFDSSSNATYSTQTFGYSPFNGPVQIQTSGGSSSSNLSTQGTWALIGSAASRSYGSAPANSGGWIFAKFAPVASNPTGTASLAGTGSITASGTMAASGTAGQTGTGSITATGATGTARGASLAGVGTITGSGATGTAAAASVAGVGSIIASGSVVAGTGAGLTGTGTITATGVVGTSATASLAGTGSITASGLAVAGGPAALNGVGSIIASGVVATGTGASLAGTGSIAATGRTGVAATGARTGTGSITASGVLGTSTAATLTGVGTITATGVVGQGGTATLAGTGSISATGATGTTQAAALTGTGSITATGTLGLPGVIPVRTLTTEEVLYGSRTTAYRFELLTHDPVAGTDSLVGYLDGVIPGGSLNWGWTQAVKGSGTLNVADLDVAQAGMTRIGDVNLNTVRIRPVLVIEGLPDIPLGVFLVTAGPETWSAEGRVYALELHDRTTVLDQDQVDAAFTAVVGTPIMTQIATLILTAGEKFVPDSSETRGPSVPIVWPVGTSKLQIVNDLLGALNFNALTVTGAGLFQAVPYQRPAIRTITYELLNGVERQLIDGETSIYQPDWNRDRDIYGVPNKVVVVGQASGATAPSIGTYTNTTPTSPFSYSARGRWITSTVTGVEVPDGTDPVTFLTAVAQASLIAQSSPQATVTVKHLPLPLRVGDVVEFASAPAGIDVRHVVVGLQLDLVPTGLMQSNLQEVIDL